LRVFSCLFDTYSSNSVERNGETKRKSEFNRLSKPDLKNCLTGKKLRNSKVKTSGKRHKCHDVDNGYR